MRVVVVGSCLSAKVAKAMCQHFSATVLASLHHVRSDILRAYFAEAAYEPPDEASLFDTIERYGSKGKEQKNRARAADQVRAVFERVRESLRSADALVMDNHYELSYAAKQIVTRAGRHNVSLYFDPTTSGQLPDLPALTSAEAQTNLAAFAKAVATLNPEVQTFYIAYPYHHLDVETDAARLRKAKAFADDVELPPGFHALPPVPLTKRSQSSLGSLYFVPHVYEVYARHICVTWECLRSGGAPPSLNITDFEAADRSKIDGPNGTGSPYHSLPPRNFWRTGIADRNFLELEDLYRKKFEITRQDRIATFGSCFAQHVGKALQEHGFNVLDYEPPPAGMDPTTSRGYGYGLYSARYGNVYTARQLRQLFLRAFGRLEPKCALGDGPYFDAFRPHLQPDGYPTIAALNEDVNAHLDRVRQLFLDLDVMVMTLGLTEAWVDAEDGAVYPVCPGIQHGRFDSDRHQFRNFGYPEVMSDMEAFITDLHLVNPEARTLLTVSPVPLTATAEAAHVLAATTYSKAVLRAVCGDLEKRSPSVDYFPSYEIVASHPCRGVFFDPNLRTVSRRGVEHVMAHFFREHAVAQRATHPAEDFLEEHCDEAFIDLARSAQRRP